LDLLSECLDLSRVRKALASLPDTLDAVYDRILCNIGKEYCVEALKILQWLSYSARPLLLTEIVDVIAVDINCELPFDPERRLLEPLDILTICSSLVTVAPGTIKNELGKITRMEVRLAHFSVKEYLVSKRIQAGPASRYGMRDIEAHTSIAQICIAYFLHLDKPGIPSQQIVKDFPLARYAANYWPHHTRVADIQESANLDRQQVVELLKYNVAALTNWINIFNPDDKYSFGQLSNVGTTSIAPPLYYDLYLVYMARLNISLIMENKFRR
jgi:hypothetical protein